MTEHTIDTLANALYEGHSSLENLAECMAKQHGKADALSFFGMMDEDVQFFWKDIARQIIEHSKEWKENEGSCCVLSEKESKRLASLRLSKERNPPEYKTIGIEDSEVYDHRCHLLIALMRSNPGISWRANVKKDGTVFPGWFVAGMNLPTGNIVYYLPIWMWEMLDNCGMATMNMAPSQHIEMDDITKCLAEWFEKSKG